MKALNLTYTKPTNSLITFIFLIFTSLNCWSQSNDDYTLSPPLSQVNGSSPMVMLALSSDHQLFFKAYSDYTDLNGDGTLDITYDNDIEYLGYFDHQLCYVYDDTDKVFTPSSQQSNDNYCNAGVSNQWSGNFLNWASMTRMDAVRRILYGGKRSTDTSSQTILERAYIPNDSHSFAKYYNESDLGKLTPYGNFYNSGNGKANGLTLCNTTVEAGSGKVYSQNSSSPPLLRAIRGNYGFWASSERFQCLYQSELNVFNKDGIGKNRLDNDEIDDMYSGWRDTFTDSPADNKKAKDYIVRVEVCKSGFYTSEDCKQYPNGNYKPIGLLQKFGDDDTIEFGMISGSYQANKSGGMLRKNISSFKDEVNTLSDGTFKAMPSTGGIVGTLDEIRIANYVYNMTNNSNRSGTYFDDDCNWQLSSFKDGECTNWGNPFAEILQEAYHYLGGKEPHDDFGGVQDAGGNHGQGGDDDDDDDDDDENDKPSRTFQKITNETNEFPSLLSQAWNSSLDDSKHCAKLNVIGFNSSITSYDGDQISISGIGAPHDAAHYTDIIGNHENINGNDFFVGGTGSSGDDNLCTAKTVNNLSSVRGTCPNAPRVEGTYLSAGISYYANQNDINDNVINDQTVTTYGVALAPALPQLTIPVPTKNKTIRLLPACRNTDIQGNCALVDFKVLQPHTQKSGSSDTYVATFYVSWEDSEQGGDFDQDMHGILKYEINPTRITVRTQVISASTGNEMGFGFVIGGANKVEKVNGNNPNANRKSADGFHAVSGINGFNKDECNKCQVSDNEKWKRFSIGSSDETFLESPLFYAAKWGGFTDENGNGIPDLTSEWDSKINATGADGQDGIPDNYHSVVNPRQLKQQFDNVLNEIAKSSGLGSVAAVTKNASNDVGIILENTYYPSYPVGDNPDVSWVGALNAAFIDAKNNIREDSNSNLQLDNNDRIVDVYFDSATNTLKAQRYLFDATTGTRGSTDGAAIDASEIKYLWSAHKILADVSEKTVQRSTFGNSATQRRYIFTGADEDADGIVKDNETFNFDSASFDPSSSYPNRFRLLGLNSANQDDYDDIVNYIRGEEISGFRSRMTNFDKSDDAAEPWILGDISNSEPLIVGAPKAGYDIEFGDRTYKAYRQQYQNRRQMVYVGANDGMLHAFNAGIFNSSTFTYTTGSQALGSELWAYVPYNLLPHLQWLTSQGYRHTPYVDGTLQAFDVNIFTPSATHKEGWGTILVAQMHFGGGRYTLDPDSDDDGDPNDDINLSSGILIFDITDPEQPPTLIAEISDDELGFTTAEVDIVKFRAPNSSTGRYNSPSVNRWYLAIGSGPRGASDAANRAAQINATSDSPAKLFLFNLHSKTLVAYDRGLASSFVGGVNSVDWDKDFSDDALYYGVVSGTPLAPTGELRREALSFDGMTLSMTSSKLLDVSDQAFATKPFTRVDSNFNFWVFAGTGRFFTDADIPSETQNSYYAIKEAKTASGALSTSTRAKANLVDVSDLRAYTNNVIDGGGVAGAAVTLNTGEEVNNTSDLNAAIQANSGWYMDFDTLGERAHTKTNLYATSLLFSVFKPSAGGACDANGGSTRLFQREFTTGVPPSYSANIDTSVTVTDSDGNEGKLILDSLALGDALFSTPSKDGLTKNNKGEYKDFDPGEVPVESGRQSWREIPYNW